MDSAEMEGRAARLYRERLLGDVWRPGYHFCVPDGDGRPGDPNGCFYAEGRHHLMYLYKRDGNFCWGHASSADLLHWRHHADALREAPGDAGCFSGGAFVDDDGTAYLTYWIYNPDGSKPAPGCAGIGLAMSRPPYSAWTRAASAIIPSERWGIAVRDGRPVGCADPSNIWKKDGVYYLQAGNLLVLDQYGRDAGAPEEMRGDWTELFSSHDLTEWAYKGRFYCRRADNRWTAQDEDNMCPAFYPLPASPHGGPATDRYLELFISHNRGCQYYIGAYAEDRFVPLRHGRMTWTDSAFFAPEAYLDENGRLIQISWLRDNPPDDARRFGWSGVMSLPRVLWLAADGSLGIAPAPEVDALATRLQTFDPARIAQGEPLPLYAPHSARLCLNAPSGIREPTGLTLTEGTSACHIRVDPAAGKLIMDASRSLFPFVEEAPFSLAGGEALEMTVYIDRSVIEVFVNRQQAISRRFFAEEGERRVYYAGDGGALTLSAAEMMPSMPY